MGLTLSDCLADIPRSSGCRCETTPRRPQRVTKPARTSFPEVGIDHEGIISLLTTGPPRQASPAISRFLREPRRTEPSTDRQIGMEVRLLYRRAPFAELPVQVRSSQLPSRSHLWIARPAGPSRRRQQCLQRWLLYL